MTYIEMKSLATLNTRIVTFDAKTGKQLFDTLTARKEYEAKFNHYKVVNIWAGHKARLKGVYALTDGEDTVICAYLEHMEGE